MNRDPVLVDLDKHLAKQDPDFVEQWKIDEEIAERAADEACSTFTTENDNDEV